MWQDPINSIQLHILFGHSLIGQNGNSQIFCVVFARDSWNYYAGEKGSIAKYIHKIAKYSLYGWTVYINENKWNKVLPPHVISFYHMVEYFLWFNKAIWGKDEEEDGLLGLAV